MLHLFSNQKKKIKNLQHVLNVFERNWKVFYLSVRKQKLKGISVLLLLLLFCFFFVGGLHILELHIVSTYSMFCHCLVPIYN